MKKTTILFILTAFAVNAFCQNDTTFYFKNNEIKVTEHNGDVQISIKPDSLSAEDKLFKGNYSAENDQSVVPVFCFSKFVKHKGENSFYAHGIGLFAGFSNLALRDLLKIGIVSNAELKLSSYEIGFTVFDVHARLSKQYGWLVYTGLGFKVQQYNTDRNYAFVVDNDITIQKHPETGILYSKSRLVQWYMYMPIMFEYQKKITKKSHFFIQAGVELGLKLSSKSSVVYRNDHDKKIREKLGRGMNVNPLTVDAKVEIGFNDLALYARYGLIDLFRKNRGPEVVPVAAGVIWHF
jgi:hypothetical protein